jgi:hypothetical protein
MKVVSSSRRQIVMAILLGLAAIGAAMRHWADNPSLARDIGTLLLVLWLPAVGNVVAFVVRQTAARVRPATAFDDAKPFLPQLRADITPVAGGAQSALRQRDCTVIVGSEGFRARTAFPFAQALQPDGPLELEFLRPSLALARLSPGTDFHLLVGNAVVASGRVQSTPATPS